MKRTLVLSLILLSAGACKKNEKGIEPDPLNSTELFDQDGISAFDDKNIEVVTNYTKIDTFYTNITSDIGISAKVPDGESAIFKFTVYNYPVNITRFSSQWDTKGKYKIAQSDFDLDLVSLAGSVPVTASVTYLKTGVSRTKKAQVNITNKTSSFDLFNVNFGMTKEAVKTSESKRLNLTEDKNLGWLESSINAGYLGKSSLFSKSTRYSVSGATYYEFEDDKLIKVSEIIDKNAENFQNQGEYNAVKSLFTRLGAGKIPVEYAPATNTTTYAKAPVSWTKNGISFKFQKRDFELKTGKISAYALTYTKGN